MWIFDSSVRRGVEFWGKDGKKTKRVTVSCPPRFYFSLPDPSTHREMLEALEARYRLKECTFQTVYGPVNGYEVYGGRSVAEAIEQQTRFAVQLYDVDVRLDQRWLAEHRLFPCSHAHESRFAIDFACPLTHMTVDVKGDPFRIHDFSHITVRSDHNNELTGTERVVLSDFFDLISTLDPDVILLPDADLWVRQIIKRARHHNLKEAISRTGRFREVDSRSYWSYGRVEYKGSALMPEGRILIDTARSFNYREGGLHGILLASRLTGITPNLAARLTAGTLISSYEVYEALQRGIAIPFRKSDAEEIRKCSDLRTTDRGGMMFQPIAGVYEAIHELDFTSLYPSIIALFNLSPETLYEPEKRGFLADVLNPLLTLRHETKQLKKWDPAYAGMDSLLKWMLVTCFGYTGYRNAKFGRIEVHEKITFHAREILLQAKACAEALGFDVLHGIVDCLWVRGPGIERLKERIERETRLRTECATYDWITFLPMKDGTGSYNQYYGRLPDGTLKLRGIMARRGDTPEYVKRMQLDLLDIVKMARTREELMALEGRVKDAYEQYVEALPDADDRDLTIMRRISRLSYAKNCIEGSAVMAYKRAGITLSPGMEIGYIVQDARTCAVDLPWGAPLFDVHYYHGLLEKALGEVTFMFTWMRENERPRSDTKSMARQKNRVTVLSEFPHT